MTPSLPGCSVDDCPRPVHAKGYCQPHYRRNRTGELDKPIRKCRRGTDEERFWSKVIKADDCWTWTATRGPDGYGRFSIWGRNVITHRWIYELLVGPIPDGYEVDHLCSVRECVRPDHLEAVTKRENSRRSEAKAIAAIRANAAARTHCINGHPYESTEVGARLCLTCRRKSWREFRQRKRAAA